MPLPPSPDRGRAWIAVHRFGLGPRPGEVEAARGDPEGWLLAQLRGPPGAPPLDRLLDHGALHAKVLRAGRRPGPGLNEHLAREVQELRPHGAGGGRGHTRAEVRGLAGLERLRRFGVRAWTGLAAPRADQRRCAVHDRR